MGRASVTLDVDDELLARAREIAAAHQISVAQMIERFLRVVSLPPLTRNDLPPITRRLSGILPPMPDEEVLRVIEEEIGRKHGGL